jgi:hypothetical protein
LFARTGEESIKGFLLNMAYTTWCISSFEGALHEDGNIAQGDLSQLFDISYFLTWKLRNFPNMNGVNIGNWQGGRGGVNACDLSDVINDSSDDWWECSTEGDGHASHDIRQRLCRWFAIEDMMKAIPRSQKASEWNGTPPGYYGSPRKYDPCPGDPEWRTQQDIEVPPANLSHLYTVFLLPDAIEHIAGVYMHFLDVVRHPPILRHVEVTQETVCKYSKYWETPGANRVLLDACTPAESEQWINEEARLHLFFGHGAVPIRMRDVSVRVGDPGVEVTLEPNATRSSWDGTFLPPADGSLDGVQVLVVNGADDHPHFDRRQLRGDVLDAEPATLAKAAEVLPYEWAGYTPGPDTNHSIRIDMTAPAVTIESNVPDGHGGRIAVCWVQDVTSGITSIEATGVTNEMVTVAPFTVGGKERVRVYVETPSADFGDGFAILARDVAGNSVSAVVTSTPIEVYDLQAAATADGVHLRWRLSADAQRDVHGVAVLRAREFEGPYESVTPAPLHPEPEMSFLDTGVKAGAYWYRLRLSTASGEAYVSNTVAITVSPSRRTTTLHPPVIASGDGPVEFRYSLGEPAAVHIDVLDVAGRRILAFSPGHEEIGEHRYSWGRRDASGQQVARGIYFVRLTADRTEVTRKFALAQ